MRWQRGPLQSRDFGENGRNGAMALNRQNRQTVNRSSNEMAKGPFGKWRFRQKWRIWQKWQKWQLITKIAKL